MTMKEKIKNGYLFNYDNQWFMMRVGSRAYILPIKKEQILNSYMMFDKIEENKVIEVYKPDCRRVEL